MTIKLIGNLHYDNSNVDSHGYILEMTVDRLDQIKDIAVKVKELDAYEVVYFDSAIEVVGTYFDDEEDSTVAHAKIESISNSQSERTDVVTLHICNDAFRFTGVVKYCNDLFNTGWIYFKDVDKIGETVNFNYYV